MNTDYAQRFLFEHLDIRGRLVCLTGAWQRMIDGRGYPEPIQALLGRIAALTVLLGASQKSTGRVALQITGSGPVTLLIADCSAALEIRGMARFGAFDAPTERALFGNGRLALTLEDQSSGQTYQSLVPLEGESLAEMFEHYLAQSEQLSSFLRLHVSATGLCGLLLEKLPGTDARDADAWHRVTRRAERLTLESAIGEQPHDLLTRLFPGELLRVFRLAPVTYHCPYDEEKVKSMLRGLGRAEADSILAEHGEIVVKNEMCNHEYRFDRAAVEAMFS